MTSPPAPEHEDPTVEALAERLRLAERRLALAEAQLALARVATVAAPGDGPDGPSAAGPADLGAAIDVLFHTAATTMVLLGTDGTILRANAAAAEMWGVPLAELPGMRTVELTVAADVPDTEARVRRADGGHFVLKTYRRPDGTTVPCLALGWPLVDDDGAVVCLIGVAVPLARIATSPSLLDDVLAAAGRAVPPAER